MDWRQLILWPRVYKPPCPHYIEPLVYIYKKQGALLLVPWFFSFSFCPGIYIQYIIFYYYLKQQCLTSIFFFFLFLLISLSTTYFIFFFNFILWSVIFVSCCYTLRNVNSCFSCTGAEPPLFFFFFFFSFSLMYCIYMCIYRIFSQLYNINKCNKNIETVEVKI